MEGPIGPPGHNGSQGPAGPAGARGPPGPKGSGDFSSCQYKVKTEAMTPGFTWATKTETEPNVSTKDLLFIGVILRHRSANSVQAQTIEVCNAGFFFLWTSVG